jgi:hypothetical protein
MLADVRITSAEDTSYLMNVAMIAATLLGLTFVALSFFLIDLLKRYEGTALPAFRDRETNRSACATSRMSPPESLTDRQLLDGDPLVVFIAFSVAVTWNLFLMPLALGLTGAWGGARLWVVAAEMVSFALIMTFSSYVRNQKIRELRPYLTREELMWPVVGGGVLIAYYAATLIVVVAALSALPGIGYLAIWRTHGISDEAAAVFIIKAVAIVSLLLGTYAINKDMFIFFKTMASERMRQRWLDDFVRVVYPELQDRVRTTLMKTAADAKAVDELRMLWNEGCPDAIATHGEFKKADAESLRRIWIQLVSHRSGAAAWMLDIPLVAAWADRVDDCLDKFQIEPSRSGEGR